MIHWLKQYIAEKSKELAMMDQFHVQVDNGQMPRNTIAYKIYAQLNDGRRMTLHKIASTQGLAQN